MIHLEGAPRVFFSDESFTNNGDNCNEAITTYGTSVLQASSGEMRISDTLSNPNGYLGSTLGKSLITITRSV